jgi:uncharacterized metal-binding protein
MANGKQHAQATRKTGWVMTAVSVPMAVMLHPTLFGCAVGAWLGHLVTPDMDHHWTTYDEWRIRRWNPLLGWLWSLYWTPYQWTHPHRGSSHTWPKGTFVRFVYCLWAPILLSAFAVPYLHPVWIGIFWGSVFFGWSVADETHFRLDNL